MKPVAQYLSRLNSQTLLHVADRAGRWTYRATRGRFGATQLGMPVLLLTTTGRKTRQARTHTLQYLRDGSNLVVIASCLGAPTHPAWYVNLRHDPRVVVEQRDRRRAMTAVTATGAPRERLWRAALAIWPAYATYQARTTREIPVVILQPQAPGG
ncbi:MAG TPA: nitroreductase family deazaflavin-dependent oxidoreductase [Chloroflexia bacterium]|nr:nitroreductase family deazaflavin-dependent oxidoreductase [Chloroflexia bacterium]